MKTMSGCTMMRPRLPTSYSYTSTSRTPNVGEGLPNRLLGKQALRMATTRTDSA
jgi:hypothetical protein